MNHLVNPIGLRLGLVQFWNSSWVSLYSFSNFRFVLEDFSFTIVIKWYFKYFLLKFGFLFSHLKIFRSFGNSLFFLIFFYNAEIEKFWSYFYIYFAKEIIFSWQKKLLFNLLRGNLFIFSFLELYKKKKLRKKIVKVCYNDKSHFFSKKRFKFKTRRDIRAYYHLLTSLFLHFFSQFCVSINIINPLLRSLVLRRIRAFQEKVMLYFFKFRGSNFSLFSFFLYQIFGGALNSKVVCNYIVTKLSQRFKLFKVVDPLMKTLSRLELLDGFKIACSGRFTRKQIATYYWEKRGVLPLNTSTRFVDYCFLTVVLKNSICGVKVWLCHSSRNIRLKKFYKNSSTFNSFYE